MVRALTLGMHSNRFPLPTNQVPDPVWGEEIDDPDRHVLCRHYGLCLEEAIGKGWAGFRCGDCPSYSMADTNSNDWLSDAHACADLCLAIFLGIMPPEHHEDDS